MTRAQPLPYETALARAQHYCARGERCLSQLRTKLYEWHAEAEHIPTILERLVADGFINEERYAEVFARDKHRFSGWGQRRIATELRMRSIPGEAISRALSLLEEELDLDDQLHKALERKWRTLAHDLDRRSAYQKLVSHGLYRGYDYDAVAKVARALLDGDPDED